MIKSNFKSILVLSTTMALILASCSQNQVKQDDAPLARVSFVSGTVTYTRAGAESPAKSGDILQGGDIVKTGASASAELYVKDQGIIRVSANSVLDIAALAKERTEMKVNNGSAAFFLKKQGRTGEFSVTSPTAIAGVRGTVFLVEVAKTGDSKVALFDGAIELQNNQGQKIIMDEAGEAFVGKGTMLTEKSVQPLSSKSLANLKEMAVFQKSEILEYNSLLDEIGESDAMRELTGRDTVESGFDSLKDRKDESFAKASRSDESVIRRDTSGDPLKLPPKTTY
jgi:hypothetical protein